MLGRYTGAAAGDGMPRSEPTPRQREKRAPASSAAIAPETAKPVSSIGTKLRDRTTISDERLAESAVNRWIPWSAPRGTASSQVAATTIPRMIAGMGDPSRRNAAVGAASTTPRTMTATHGGIKDLPLHTA